MCLALAGCGPARVTCDKADLEGRSVHYCRAGSGDVTVVLESDAGADHTAWDSVAPRVAEFARVLTYDRLNLGQSDSTSELRTAEQIAAELDQLLTSAGVSGPLVLVGHGLGGWSLRAYAATRPERIRRLVLIDSPHEDFEERVRGLLTPAQLVRLDSALALRRSSMAAGARLEQQDLLGSDPPTDIDVPVTMIRGGRHPLSIPAPAAVEALWRTLHDDSLARFTFNANLVEVSGAIRLDRPDTLVSVIESIAVPRGWLGRIRAIRYLGQHLVTIALSAIITALLYGLGRRYRPEVHTRWSTGKIHLWELIPRWGTPRNGRAVELVRAINRWALAGVDPAFRADMLEQGRSLYTGSKALRVWKRILEPVWNSHRNLVEPAGVLRDGTQDAPVPFTGFGTLLDWLADCRNPAAGESRPGRPGLPSCHIAIEGSGGAGKTTFVHQLYFELVRRTEGADGLRLPVPMLASVANLKLVKEPAKRLTGESQFNWFISLWLEVRGIVVPALRHSLLQDFQDALGRGDIVMLLDGYDDLGPDLLDLVNDALKEMPYAVIARRYSHHAGLSHSRRLVQLNRLWTLKQMMAHLQHRWREFPDAAARLSDLFDRVLAGDESNAAQWLRLPRNLEWFLSTLDPRHLPDEAELRRRSVSAPKAFRAIVQEAIERQETILRSQLPEESRDQLIRDRLFQIALNDPADLRRRKDPAWQDREKRPLPDLDDPVGQLLRALGELFEPGPDDGPDRLSFKQEALREFYFYGRIALELHRSRQELSPAHALVRFSIDAWGPAEISTLADWLRELEPDPGRRVSRRIAQHLAGSSSPRPGWHTPVMIRNLLELLLHLRLMEQTGDGEIELNDLDLSGIAGNQLNLSAFRVVRCSFERAELRRADFTHAHLVDCRFSGADLSEADAAEATFERCDFGPDSAAALVDRMEIERARFIAGGQDQRAMLIQRRASPRRSRYRAEFGASFARAQEAYLGEAVRRLEDDCYLPAIRAAVEYRQSGRDRPVYLIDLMAGGSHGRVAGLLDAYRSLHILGVDRDPAPLPPSDRLRWKSVEIGANGSHPDALSLDLNQMLIEEFGADAGADVIIAKKALHELDRRLQSGLIHQCARALRPGGRLVLFVDAPGPMETVPSDLPEMLQEHEALRSLLTESDRDPAEVLQALQLRRFDGSETGQLSFANTWILLKDWVNLNDHEVRNRYFASVAEIRDWARPALGDPLLVKVDYYRINPLIFNELGIQRVLHYLSHLPPESQETGISSRDQIRLAEWIGGDERFGVLLEFTRSALPEGSPLALALRSRPEPVRVSRIDDRLKPLDPAERAPAFDLSCAVMVFEKQAKTENRQAVATSSSPGLT